MISLSHARGRGVVGIGETNVDVSVCVLHIILSDVLYQSVVDSRQDILMGCMPYCAAGLMS